MRKWTNDTIDLALSGRPVSRNQDVTYVNQPSVTPIQWICSTCNHVWHARVDNVIGKQSGCPKCAGNVAYTVDSLNNKLLTDNRLDLKVLSIINGSIDYNRCGQFRCTTCNNKWIANIHNVIKFRYGCPHCNGNLSKRVVDADGNRFHSKLEHYFWVQYCSSGISYKVLRQQKYTTGRRLTCDFFIPEISTWVEVSGSMMLKRPDYLATIDEKRAIVDGYKHQFIVLSSIPEINQFITTLKDNLNDANSN